MASPNDKPNYKNRGKKGSGAEDLGIAAWTYHYSGLKFIYRKFNPPKDSGALPTGVIWLIVIYVAFFGVASQRYENRIDIIENRANAIFAQLAVPSIQKKALSRISRVQNMLCPYKPNILNPFSVFLSLFGPDSNYEEMVKQLKETIENWKDSLDSVDLWEADLRRAFLREANFQRANLHGADLMGADLWGVNLVEADLREAILREATSLTVEQLCEASTLYQAELNQELGVQIKQECPDILKEPQKNNPEEKK